MDHHHCIPPDGNHLLPIESIGQMLILTFKALQGAAAAYIPDLLCPYHTSTPRSFCHTAFRPPVFYVAATNFWNNQPTDDSNQSYGVIKNTFSFIHLPLALNVMFFLYFCNLIPDFCILCLHFISCFDCFRNLTA